MLSDLLIYIVSLHHGSKYKFVITSAGYLNNQINEEIIQSTHKFHLQHTQLSNYLHGTFL